LPLNLIVPLLGFIKPAIIDNRVDLPQPDGPTMEINSPSSIHMVVTI